MNKTLYRYGIKSAWLLFAILLAVITMYYTIITAMYDPKMGNVLTELAKSMPEIMAMMGMNGVSTTLEGFLASYLYGFIMLLIPMLFSAVTANSLVARKVDSGAMANLLSAPVSCLRIVLTQMAVLLSGITLMVVCTTGIGLLTCEVCFPGTLHIGRFLMMNLGTLALQWFIGGICILSSCIFHDSKRSFAVGVGIPLFSYVLQMIGNFSSELEGFRYASFFTLFDQQGLSAGEQGVLPGLFILLIGAVLFYTAAAVIFTKKDIPV